MTIEELGRRAVACKHWRWMAGMASFSVGYDQEGFYTWTDQKTGGVVVEPWVRGEWSMRGPFRLVSEADIYDGEEVLPLVKRRAIPDLSDPATLGCLIALVREAYEGEWTRELSSFFDATAMGWRVGVILKGTALIPYAKGCSLLPFESEAEALVSALEAAP